MMILDVLRRILGAVPGMAWAIVAALAWGGYQHHRATVAERAVARIQHEHLRAEAEATKRALAEQQRVNGAMQGAIDDATVQVARAARDLAAAGAVRDRLLGAAREAGRRAAGGCAAATDGAASAGAADVVPAELYRWADGRAGELAAALDSARTAGLGCERAYDAVNGGAH